MSVRRTGAAAMLLVALWAAGAAAQPSWGELLDSVRTPPARDGAAPAPPDEAEAPGREAEALYLRYLGYRNDGAAGDLAPAIRRFLRDQGQPSQAGSGEPLLERLRTNSSARGARNSPKSAGGERSSSQRTRVRMPVRRLGFLPGNVTDGNGSTGRFKAVCAGSCGGEGLCPDARANEDAHGP